jgi:hypothetical protein
MAWWAMINSNAPVLAGIAAGLVGAAVAGAAGLVLVFTVDAVYSLEWAAYAAGLAGYPVGVWCGVVACNKRRRAPGSIWLALLGTLAGLALSMAVWEAIGRSFVMGTAGPSPVLVWIGLLSVIGPVALIPGLASLAYDFRPSLGLWGSGTPPGTSPESARQARPKGKEEEAQAEHSRSEEEFHRVTGVPEEAKRAGEAEEPAGEPASAGGKAAPSGACSECGLDNPPGSRFCLECGATLERGGATLPHGTVHE